MKLYKDFQNNIFAYEIDGSQDHLIGDKKPITNEEAEEIKAAKAASQLAELGYKEKRMMTYPSIGDQLDMMFHNGFDYWKKEIQKIKDQYPKD